MAYLENDFSVTENGNGSVNISNMFEKTKSFKDVTSYKLMRGVPDFGSLVQFNPYETGYAAFIICGMPKFIEKLATLNAGYNKLVQNWAHIIEYEFKNFEGLDDISADSIELGDDLNSINVISKVNMQSASEFSLTYDEKSGSPLTKFAKLYLTGIKDPRTQVKTYHGLIHSRDGNNTIEPGFENEVFTFLFIATDNTMRNVEAAYLLIGCQLLSAETSMYNYSKGDIGKKDISVRFSGYPITSSKIDQAAQDMMDFLLSSEAKARQIIVNSDEFNYTGIDKVAKTLQGYNMDATKDYATVKAANSEVSYRAADYYVSTNDILVTSTEKKDNTETTEPTT